MARTPRFVPEAAKMGTDEASGKEKRDIAPARKPFPDVELHPPERAGQSLNRALEESFARVREDIVQIKKALNDQAEQMSQLGAKVEGFVNMYEFFEYMQHIDSQLEGLKERFLHKDSFESHVKELSAKMAEMDRLLARDAEMKREIEQLKKSPPEQAGGEGALTQVYQEIAKLDGDLLDMKKSLNRHRKLEYDIANQLGGVETVASALKRMEADLQANAAHIEELRRRVLDERRDVEHDMMAARGTAQRKKA